MFLFSKRPLLLSLFFFLTLCAACAFVPTALRMLGVWIFAFLSLTSAIVAIAFAVKKHKASYAFFTVFLIVLFSFLACFSSYSFWDKKLLPLENTTTSVEIVGEVRECAYTAPYTSEYTVAVQSVNGEKSSFLLLLSITEPQTLSVGNVLRAKATLQPFDGKKNGFNERIANLSDGILVQANCESYTVEKENSNSIPLLLYNLRRKIENRINNAEFNESGGFLKALLLGNRDGLASSASLHFRRLGISHILSISGTHFSTLLGMIALLLSLLRVNKRVGYAIMIPIAIFYMALTGFMPSVCRAGFMTILSFLGLLSGKMRDSYTALFLSVFVLLIVQPHTVCSIGLWLSFSATFTILILLDLFGSIEKVAKSAWYTKFLYAIFLRVMISFFITVYTMPIIAKTFGETSVISLFSNLLVVPLIELFLYVAPFAVLFANFLPLTKAVNWFFDPLMGIIERICQTDGLLITLKPPFVFWISLAGVLCTVLLLALPLKKKGLVLLPGCVSAVVIAICLGIFMHQHADVTNLTYFKYKGNDGFVLTDRNAALYIDISDGSSTPAYTGSYLAEENFSPELGGVLYTHYHTRHAQTLQKLAASTRIRKVYLPYTEDEAAEAMKLALAEIAMENAIEIVYFSYDTPIQFESCSITVLTPVYISRSTHPVVCLEVHKGDTDVLYLGSSFNDTKLDYSAYETRAEFIFYGQHNPVAKNVFSVYENAFPIYCNEDREKLAKNPISGYVMHTDEEQYEIVLK